MRFRSLHLLAFGHFTNHVLDFTARPRGLHIVFGQNEAGKSTALRAVRDLLYGVPQLSADTFLHGGQHLRIGAVLENETGETLEVVRRKGRKHTLLDPDGNPLDEAILEPWLGGIDQRLFSVMFGLDHQSLRDGARSLLEGEGNLSESLFGASLGSGHARRVLGQLRDRADALFTNKGRGRKRINQEIAEVREARKLVAHHSTTASVYLEREEEWQAASRELDIVKKDRARLKQEKSATERWLTVLPLIAKRAALLEARTELGQVADLPGEIEVWRTEAVRDRDEAERQAGFLETEIARQQERLTQLPLRPALVEIEPQRIESLSHHLGQFRKAQLDLPKRQGELRAVRERAEAELRALGFEQELSNIESLRLSRADEQKLRRLCAEKTRFDAMIQERSVKWKESQLAAAERKKELDAEQEPPDESTLTQVLERAYRQLDLEERLQAARQRGTQLERRIDDRFTALGCYRGELPRLAELPFPPAETLGRFEQRLRELEVKRQHQTERVAEIRRRIVSIDQGLKELQRQGEVPTPERLIVLRRGRDERYRELRAGLVEGAALERSTRQLDELWNEVRETDHYADHLRAEADRLAKQAASTSARDAAHVELQLSQEELSQTEQAHAACQAEWQELWRPLFVAPLPPREMIPWLKRVDELRQLSDQAQEQRAEVRALEARLAETEKELSATLIELGEPKRTLWESLARFIERAATVARRIQAARARRHELVQRLERSEEEVRQNTRSLAELKDAQKQFRVEWTRGLRLLGLDKDHAPEEVMAIVDGLIEVFHRMDEAAALERRIVGMQRDETQLTEDVRKLAEQVAPELSELTLEDAAARLIRDYRKATVDAESRLRVELELDRHRAELGKVQKNWQRAKERLSELVRLAGVETPEELARAEEQTKAARDLERRIGELEEEIVAQGDGSALAPLLERARGTNAEAVRQRVGELELELEKLDARLEGLVRRKTTAETQLGELGAGAFRAAEELALRTAQLRASLREYVHLRLSAVLLGRQIERYRDENQGPVLSRARALFPRLTLGAYRGLGVGYDQRDRQILLCVRADGREVGVERLSDGTRDQLYLSLRLATLARYMEQKAPLPLILDDILIHFDDERARAALSVLAEVAETTQVLFFTHHQRLVELGRAVVPSDVLNVCELPSQETVASEFAPSEAVPLEPVSSERPGGEIQNISTDEGASA